MSSPRTSLKEVWAPCASMFWIFPVMKSRASLMAGGTSILK